MSYSCFGAFQWCKGKKDSQSQQAQEIATNNVRLFSFNSLRSATRDFHPSHKIGGGGFGVVYRGVLRDGTQVAIKCLSAESNQGTNEFLTEINMISNIHHPNLVELVGCCVEGNNRILVYEYLENNSLASILLGSKSKYVALDWPTRAAICRGDFGLAKLFPDNVTHVSTRVAGTVGYLAPEYAILGQLTKKVDVYSFGVLLLEIISGRSSSKAAFGVDFLVLVEWTWKLREEERLLELVDPELTQYPEEEVMRFITVGLFCTQASPYQRPTMKQVVEMLTKAVNLNDKILTQPGVYRVHSSQHVGGGSGSSAETSSSLKRKGKQSVDPPDLPSIQLVNPDSVTDIQPR
ncbi:hypothetical protein LWI28_008872 [Acer negundo]|uniref:Protein kinase domain-containing protein n=1 Tax=Acer negundo TaxID=4023 RepID=A0AAD5NEI8_ACENE|nr:hypothetical protein LWI28_008872 [Acer negundo]